MKRQTLYVAPGDTENQIVQTVSYDPAEDWINVSNSGDTLNMSRENWVALVQMAFAEILDSGAQKPIVIGDVDSHAVDALKYAILNRGNGKAIVLDSKPYVADERKAAYMSTTNDGENWVGGVDWGNVEKIVPERDTYDPNAETK